MRLGIVTDIHSDSVKLAAALAALRHRGTDRIITLGDTCEAFGPVEGSQEVARLLLDCDALAIWGNHDVPLCPHFASSLRDRVAPCVIELMTQARPRLELAGCHFSHVHPLADPLDMQQLWSLGEGELNLPRLAERSLAELPQHRFFTGHYHCWFAATPEGPLIWQGERPLELALDRRYFVVIAAVCDGWCALFDTSTGLLEPIRCSHEAT